MVDITIKPMIEKDLDVADSIYRLAFGTFLGFPAPEKFGGDSDYVRQRWTTDPEGALGAYMNDELVGSNFVGTTGSVGHFGPLTSHPKYWEKHIEQQLLKSTLRLLEKRSVTLIEFMSFPESPKHLALYQKFGFWPRFLTPVMSTLTNHPHSETDVVLFSAGTESEQEIFLEECKVITNSIYQGMDLEGEILATLSLDLGDTLMIRDKGRIAGFAICRYGPGTEGGSGSCLIKFGAALPGGRAEKIFRRLLNACVTFAADQSCIRLFTGINTARHGAYQMMLKFGFRTEHVSVSMTSPNVAAYNRPDVFIIDDWR